MSEMMRSVILCRALVFIVLEDIAAVGTAEKSELVFGGRHGRRREQNRCNSKRDHKEREPTVTWPVRKEGCRKIVGASGASLGAKG